jgi:HrpA-like RNA helicase
MLIAGEMDVNLDVKVDYLIRFEDCSSSGTSIQCMTD